MKKIYKKPFFEVIEMAEKTGVMQEHSPELGGDDALGKENNFTFDIEDPYELWGDESGDDDWLVDNNN